MCRQPMQEAADVLGELEDLRDRLQASEQARSTAEASRASPESRAPETHAADCQELPESAQVLQASLQVGAHPEMTHSCHTAGVPHIKRFLWHVISAHT